MKKIFLVIGLMMALLAACSSGGTISDTAEAKPALKTDYENALSVQGQLALGTVRLEEAELAVDEAQAAELLPLWRALQSLSNSGTVAEAELEALANQIQEAMSPAQIEAIAAMGLTTDTLTEMMERGELGPGGFGGGPGATNDSGDGAAGFPAGGPPGGFPAGGPAGGGPPGGFAGGGPAGGFPGGGPGFAGDGEVSEDALATRQAAFESGDFQELMLMNLAIRLLTEKTGEVIENPGAAIDDTVYSVVSEATGLSVEELQAQTAAGKTLAEVIEANGGDPATVQAAVAAALEEGVPEGSNMDAAQVAADWLGIEQ